MKRCQSCGQMIADTDTYCPSCGAYQSSSQPNTPPRYDSADNEGYGNGYEAEYLRRNNAFDTDPASGKSRGVAGLLAIFLGGLGVQYFYLGKVGGGFLCLLLSLVTCGIWEFVMLIQGILMLCMDNRSFVQKYVQTTSTMPLF